MSAATTEGHMTKRAHCRRRGICATIVGSRRSNQEIKTLLFGQFIVPIAWRSALDRSVRQHHATHVPPSSRASRGTGWRRLPVGYGQVVAFFWRNGTRWQGVARCAGGEGDSHKVSRKSRILLNSACIVATQYPQRYPKWNLIRFNPATADREKVSRDLSHSATASVRPCSVVDEGHN